MGDPAIGTAVLVSNVDDSELVAVIVVAATEEGLAVVPISDEVRMGTDWDLFLPQHLLGYAAIAQTWNHGLVLAEQVRDSIAQLDSGVLADLHRMVHAASRSDGPPLDVLHGPPALDAGDPRLLFQEEVAEQLLGFWEPAMSLAGAATLGEAIRQRRLELGLPEDMAPGMPELERDVLYLPRAMAAKDLATILRRLRIRASQRVALLARLTLEMQVPAIPRGGTPVENLSPTAYVLDLLEELERNP